MYFTIERIKRILSELRDYIYVQKEPIKSYKIKQCGYKAYKLHNEESDQWQSFSSNE
jgi:alpha-mannosidase